jgi:hypothetical protein
MTDKMIILSLCKEIITRNRTESLGSHLPQFTLPLGRQQKATQHDRLVRSSVKTMVG